MDRVDWDKFRVKEALWLAATTGKETMGLKTPTLTPEGVQAVVDEFTKRWMSVPDPDQGSQPDTA